MKNQPDKENKQIVYGWGHYPTVEAPVYEAADAEECRDVAAHMKPLIARGLGRSYGDAALGENILSCTAMNRFLDFDREQGILHARAGVSLNEILQVIVPHGWFLPVTPGTKFVTLAGAIAADVHGKNHHNEGAFSAYLQAIEVLTANGQTILCTPDAHADLFSATCGGMGLTGMILSARIRLKKISTAYIHQNNLKARNLDEVFRLIEKHANTTYSVAWLDCLAKGKNLGRSVLMLGEHATPDQLRKTDHVRNPFRVPAPGKLSMPFYWPPLFLSRPFVKAFNQLYYARQSRINNAIVSYDPFFYPLDGILNWNRMYGKKGFLQYQFVLPEKHSFDGMKEVLEKVVARGAPSFLTVLKLLGPGEHPVSFPMKGYTLALDFPVQKGVFALLDELDTIVNRYGGRIYLAKDARMSSRFFHDSYPGIDRFRPIKAQWDPNHQYRSLLSDRLNL